jgi:putative photosynthetic complex assembly protein
MNAMSKPVAAPSTDHFPRWVLMTAGGILAFTLISVGMVRLTGKGPDQLAAPAAVERALLFEDRADGGINVVDFETGKSITVLHGEQGFVRGTVRTLARERRIRQVGAEQPFALVARQDGGLTLFDPSTGKRVDLEAFGPTNAGAFAKLLEPAVPAAKP